MSDQVRQARRAVAEVYQALRDTREGGYSHVLVGFATKVIRCPRSIPCFHAPEVHPTSDSSVGLGRAYR